MHVWLLRVSPFLVSFAVTCTFFLNFCSLVFQCGCRGLWAGMDAACNIHAQHGHHCPWCSHGYAGYAVVMAGMCVPQLAVSLFTRWSWAVRTGVAVALFPVAGAVMAAALGLWDGYWTP